MEKFNCECGSSVPVKKNGEPWKHKTPDGDQCTGSFDNGGILPKGFAVAHNDEVTPEPILTVSDAHMFEVTVSKLSQHRLDSESWHQANHSIARADAVKNGLVPSGPVALFSRTEVENKIKLMYCVRVKGA